MGTEGEQPPVPAMTVAVEAAPEPRIEAPAPAAEPIERAPTAVEGDKPAAAAEAPPERTLIEEFELKQAAEKAKTEVKPAAADPAKPAVEVNPASEDAKPETEVAAAAAELAPLAYEYKLPDTIKLDEPGREEVHKTLDEFRRDPAKGAQGLIDLHAKKMGEFAEQYAEHYNQNMHDVWNKTRRDWRAATAGHPTLGGSGYETTMADVAHLRDVAFGQIPTERRDAFKKAFNEMLHVTGAGDHPLFIEFQHSLSKFFREPSIPKESGAPVPQQKRNLRAGFYKSKTAP